MIAAPNVSFPPVGEPAYQPTRAPAYRGGGSIAAPYVPPTTAVYMPKGASLPGPRFHVNPGALAPAGVLGGFSYCGWIKQVTRPARYVGLLTVESNYPAFYLFLGHDTTIGGLFVYDERNGGAAAGAHSNEAIPAVGTWYHFAYSLWFPSPGVGKYRAWINGVPCTWGLPGNPTDGDLLGSTWDGTTNIELVNQDWDQTSQDGPVRALALVAKSPLTTAEVLLLRSQSTPGTGVSGLNALGVWPLTTKNDLTSAQGVSLTVVNGALDPDATDAPAGITVP